MLGVACTVASLLQQQALLPLALLVAACCVSVSLAGIRPLEVVAEMGHQLANMAMLYVLIGLLNKRARKAGDNAARQVRWISSPSTPPPPGTTQRRLQAVALGGGTCNDAMHLFNDAIGRLGSSGSSSSSGSVMLLSVAV